MGKNKFPVQPVGSELVSLHLGDIGQAAEAPRGLGRPGKGHGAALASPRTTLLPSGGVMQTNSLFVYRQISGSKPGLKCLPPQFSFIPP